MDDLRIKWMKEKVYTGLGLQDDAIFNDMLSRDDNQAQKQLLKVLDGTGDQSGAVIFYPVVTDLETSVEMDEG